MIMVISDNDVDNGDDNDNNEGGGGIGHDGENIGNVIYGGNGVRDQWPQRIFSGVT